MPKVKKTPTKKSQAKRGKTFGKTTAPVVSTMTLPEMKKEPSKDIRDYSILLYTPPKWGKTTFFSTFPEILFLATEPGTRGLRIYQFGDDTAGCITSWSMMLRAVELLEKETSRFENVVIDTASEAYRMAMEYVCKAQGITHPSDANDYGKTWNKVADEFVSLFKRLQATGRGVYMTCHNQSVEVELLGGRKINRTGPTLTGKAGERVLALADFIFYGDYFTDMKGNNRRVVMTQGTEGVNCGARKIGEVVNLPAYIPLPDNEADDYDTFARAFVGDDVGIDPAQLMPNAATTKSGANKVTKDRLDGARKGG
jgi:hypothetical protein